MAKLTVDELKAELKSHGFTDEQLTGMPKSGLEAIANGYMRQNDYDASMNAGKAELKTAQDNLAAANDRLNAELAEFAVMQRDGQATTTKMQRDLDAAQQAVLKHQQKLRAVAQQAGLDADAVIKEVGDVVVDRQPQSVNLDGYVKADSLEAEINKRLGPIMNDMLGYTPELMTLAGEHQALFGKPLDVNGVVTELRQRASTRGNQKSLSPRAIWEDLHGVPAARAAAEEKRVNDLVAAAESRGREAARSEMMIPGSTAAPGHRSVVFGEKGRQSAIQRPQPGTTTTRAAAAFRTGQYSQRKQGAATS